jgi:GH24 family phage-related lysozyme (muramidase)
MTKEQADQVFSTQVASYQNWKNFVKKPLSPSQQEALTSFEYNLWSGIWNKNAMNILAAVNKWDMITAGNLMQAYNKAQWKYVAWLASRRANEAKLLLV